MTNSEQNESTSSQTESIHDNVADDRAPLNSTNKRKRQAVRVIKVHRVHLRRSSTSKLNNKSNALKQRNKPAVSRIRSQKNDSNKKVNEQNVNKITSNHIF